MIKNENQFKSAMESVQEIRNQIEEIRRQFDPEEVDFFIEPINKMLEELQADIEEYQYLIKLDLEKAVSGHLKNPILLGNIGELLAKLRIAAGFSQKEMAKKLGWHQPNVSRFESDTYSSQTISKVVQYASALGVWLHVAPSLTDEPQPTYSFILYDDSGSKTDDYAIEQTSFVNTEQLVHAIDCDFRDQTSDAKDGIEERLFV